jgi:hypothetical protein
MSWIGSHPEDAEPLVRHRTARDPIVIRPRADTRQVAALQLLPLLPAILAMMAAYPSGFSLLSYAGFAVATALIQYVVARRDVWMLGERGFVEQAPAILALVSSSLYLRIRADRCSGHDPHAREAVPWAIGTTLASVVVALIGTFVQAGFDGLTHSLTIGG